MSAFDKQEGGNHYKHLAIQPAEYCQRNRLGFMESCVVKYVTRHGSKNGAADLRKAIHFLELLLELEYPADAIKALDKGQDVPRGTSEDWDAGEKRMEAIGQNGNTGEHYSLPILPWRVPEASKPVTGTFDVIQVMWHDGTYSVMLPHEFGKIAEWSEVKLYRVIRDGTSPEDFPLPEPIRQWGGSRYGYKAPCGQPHGPNYGAEKCLACQGAHPKGAQCPNLTPHDGDHRHTVNVGHHPLDAAAPPPYSHANGFGIIAGIASAVSGLNGAAAAMS